MTGKFTDPRDRSFIADGNARLTKDLDADYAALGAILSRRGVDIDAVTATVASFGVALPRGVLALAALDSHVSPVRASLATCSRSSKTARSFIA